MRRLAAVREAAERVACAIVSSDRSRLSKVIQLSAVQGGDMSQWSVLGQVAKVGVGTAEESSPVVDELEVVPGGFSDATSTRIVTRPDLLAPSQPIAARSRLVQHGVTCVVIAVTTVPIETREGHR